MKKSRTINLMDLEIISCFNSKHHHFDVYRDKHGKFYCRVNGVVTQKRLTAKEIVRWFAEMLEGK